VESIVALPALGFGAKDAVAFKSRELAGDVGWVSLEDGGQPPDPDAASGVELEPGEEIAAEVGAQGEHVVEDYYICRG